MKNHQHKNKRSKLASLVHAAQVIGESALVEAAETDAIYSFAEKTLAKIIDAQFLTISVSERYGGQDVGLVPGTNLALLTILKHIGRGNLVMGRVLEGHINAQLLIEQFGTEKQKKRFAADASSGRLFAVWNTQAEDGTVLSKNKKGTYYLTGSKTFATGTDYVTRPIVTAAKKEGSWHMCVVPMEEVEVTSDPRWWNPMGMKASRSFKMTFAKAPISKINMLGSAGQYYHQPGFSSGSVRFAAVQLGAAERLLEETRIYLINLHRTKDPFQNTRLGQMAILVESGNLWLKSAASRMDHYMENPTKAEGKIMMIYINMMRTAIEQICSDIINLCQKCVGARGLNTPYHFERIIRDLSTYLRQPAPDAVLVEVGQHIVNSRISVGEMWNISVNKKKK
ncbi:acyl-CoA dehydrogenase family protein [Sphingobacterium faecium]|uniref:acyl-CoA dehydrogenase family protein n=1 Tax=Sphingobacterium faecium TaxID=34087 RepID=UPI00320880BC